MARPGRLLVGAFLLDLFFGDPSRCHPVAAFGRVAEGLERLLYRPNRSWGFLYLLLLVMPAAASATLLPRLVRRRARAQLIGALILWSTLGGRSLLAAVGEVRRALTDGELDRARTALRRLVGRDLEGLGEAQLAAAALESLADNTVDAVVGPLLWGALWGPGGAWLFRAANTLDALVGYPEGRYREFGYGAAKLDDLLVLPAAALTVSLCALLAPLQGGRALEALRAAWVDGRRHPSPGSGPVQAAFAGALGVRIGGPRRYGGRRKAVPPLGSGEPPRAEDLRRGQRLAALQFGLCTAFLAVAAERRRR